MKAQIWLRGLLTAAVLGCMAVRVLRMAAHWQSVAAFYGMGFISLLLFTGPFLAALLAAAGLWLKERARGVSLAALFVNGGLVLWEGLILLARAVNGNSGYVGAEPLLSAVVCVASGAGLLLSRKRKA